MSFISNLFKRKPGGTFVGNLIRGVANKASGGILGNGAMMITEQEADKRDLSDSDYEAKYGVKKNGVAIAPTTVANRTQPTADNPQNSPVTPVVNKIKGFFATTLGKVVASVLGIALIIFIYKKVSRKGGKRRY